MPCLLAWSTLPAQTILSHGHSFLEGYAPPPRDIKTCYSVIVRHGHSRHTGMSRESENETVLSVKNGPWSAKMKLGARSIGLISERSEQPEQFKQVGDSRMLINFLNTRTRVCNILQREIRMRRDDTTFHHHKSQIRHPAAENFKTISYTSNDFKLLPLLDLSGSEQLEHALSARKTDQTNWAWPIRVTFFQISPIERALRVIYDFFQKTQKTRKLWNWCGLTEQIVARGGNALLSDGVEVLSSLFAIVERFVESRCTLARGWKTLVESIWESSAARRGWRLSCSACVKIA